MHITERARLSSTSARVGGLENNKNLGDGRAINFIGVSLGSHSSVNRETGGGFLCVLKCVRL